VAAFAIAFSVALIGGRLIIFLVAGSRWVPIVRILSRLTDPLVTPAWNALDEYKLRRRGRSLRTSS
jgi:hypothetical protein